MAATHTSTNTMKTTTCRRSVQLITRQPSNLSNYEGYHRDETASVPFRWESQPGTPKHHFPETTLPPLAPPPSYFSSSSSSPPRSILKPQKNKNASASKSNHLLQSILPKRTARKARGSPPPPSPPANSWPSLSFSSSSSSSYPSWQRSRSVPSTPMRRPRKGKEDEEDPYDDVPSSGMCFGNAGFRGRYSSMIKKVMLGDFL